MGPNHTENQQIKIDHVRRENKQQEKISRTETKQQMKTSNIKITDIIKNSLKTRKSNKRNKKFKITIEV